MEDQKKVLITCDSTCDLSPELVARYNIKISPLYIVMDDKSYEDGINVFPQDIFDYYNQNGKLPKTAAANLQDYYDLFKKYVGEGYSIVHINLSSSMSTSHNNARLAAERFDDVYIIDSRNLSTGSGLLVIHAAELSEQGMDAKSIVKELNNMIDRIDASFVIDNLEYLHKGGRCSSVAALGANLLKLKPCIEVKKGSMGVGKKYRGKFEEVLLKYIEDRLSDAEGIELDRIFVTYSKTDKKIVDAVVNKVKETLSFKEVYQTQAGCTISVHCGPNTLGILFVRKAPII